MERKLSLFSIWWETPYELIKTSGGVEAGDGPLGLCGVSVSRTEGVGCCGEWVKAVSPMLRWEP